MGVEHLVLLVGGNPLPNYLAAATLAPARVTLVSSPQTASLAGRLRDAVETRCGATVEVVRLRDPWDAEEVSRVLDAAVGEATHLDYTGGTKVMAAHARLVLGGDPGTAARASYVEEGGRRLRFDDGSSRPLDDRLDLDVLLALHGVEPRGGDGSASGGPTPEDEAVLAAVALERPEVTSELYDLLGGREASKPAELRAAPLPLAEVLGRDLSIRALPESDAWGSDRIKLWQRFLRGTWLEGWTAGTVRRVAAGAEVRAGLDLQRHDRDLEVDVVALDGHRLFALSCTTDRTLRLCKSKAFEVAQRSRQLGGDLARSALVCLLDGTDPDSGEPRTELVKADVTVAWKAPNPPEVFGLADLRAWRSGDLSSLRRWLEC